MMNMFRKKILIVLILIILVLTSFALTDYILYRNKKEPIFCKKTEMLWDGGSYQCYGFFYKINVYKNVFGEIENAEFGTWKIEFNKSK